MTRKKQILIVDDDETIQHLFQRVLTREGYNPLTASDGLEAMAMIEKSKPDMILLDLILPEMGGMEVCQRIRQSSLTREIPIIMITGKAETMDELEGFHQGADDYICKPFDMKDVKIRIARLLKKCESN